jgi:16S rRNA (uracil1498-N3)-methyltransferase
MHRFFLSPDSLTTDEVIFPEEIARQMVAVLRLKIWDHVVVLDGQGLEVKVKLTTVTRDQVIGTVVGRREAPCEPHVRLTLFLALTQREKFEWMLQKCTEVGATGFVPLLCERALVQAGDEVDRKRERWETILKEAAEQSRRGRIPVLHAAQTIQQAGQFEFPLLLAYESDDAHSLKDVVASLPKPVTALGILIGPEGGFSDQEVHQLQNAGARSVSLGKRILRMETAAVVAAALVLHELGEMSPDD